MRDDLIIVYYFLGVEQCRKGSGGAGADLSFLMMSERARKWNEALLREVQVGHQKVFSLRAWSVTGTDSMGNWSQHQTCHSSRTI